MVSPICNKRESLTSLGKHSSWPMEMLGHTRGEYLHLLSLWRGSRLRPYLSVFFDSISDTINSSFNRHKISFYAIPYTETTVPNGEFHVPKDWQMEDNGEPWWRILGNRSYRLIWLAISSLVRYLVIVFKKEKPSSTNLCLYENSHTRLENINGYQRKGKVMVRLDVAGKLIRSTALNIK